MPSVSLDKEQWTVVMALLMNAYTESIERADTVKSDKHKSFHRAEAEKYNDLRFEIWEQLRK